MILKNNFSLYPETMYGVWNWFYSNYYQKQCANVVSLNFKWGMSL